MFKIAEQYYDILEKFTKEYTPSLSRVPLDEDRIIVDLANITCAVEYINPANQLRLYPVTLKDIDTLYSEKKMILAWSLGSEATSQGGTLKFALHFFLLD